MTTFEARFHQRFPCKADAGRALAAFGDLDRIAANTKDLHKHERLGDDTLRFELQPRGAAGVRFQPVYTCRYQPGEGELRWQTVEGNFTQEGRARFEPAGTGCTVDYEARVVIDLPVPRLAARAIRGLVEKEMEKEVLAYVRRMLAEAEG